MSKYIKLTNFIINTNYIYSITISPNKYNIRLVSNYFTGFNWNVGILGLGHISAFEPDIEVCETKHPNDYKIISDWINSDYK